MFNKIIFSVLVFAFAFYNSLHTMNELKEKKYKISTLAHLKDTSKNQFSNTLERYFEIRTIAHNNNREIGFFQEISYISNEGFNSDLFFEATKAFIVINLIDGEMQTYEKLKKNDIKELFKEKSFEYIPKVSKTNNYHPYLFIGNDLEQSIKLIMKKKSIISSEKEFRLYAKNKNHSLIIGTVQLPYYYFLTTEKFYLWSTTLDDENNDDKNNHELTPITALSELDTYNSHTLITKIIFTENDKSIIVFLGDGTVLKIAV